MVNEDNIQLLVKLFNVICSIGKLSTDFTAIPGKCKTKHCSYYRMINLMSHTLRKVLKIIHNRIQNKCEQDPERSQFAFRKSFGTGEALVVLN